LSALAGIAFYFSFALWLKYIYVDEFSKAREVVLLQRPFERFGTAVAAHYWSSGTSFDELADTPADNNRSPLLLYELFLPARRTALTPTSPKSAWADSRIGRGKVSCFHRATTAIRIITDESIGPFCPNDLDVADAACAASSPCHHPADNTLSEAA
jgi:hypothetical protein